MHLGTERLILRRWLDRDREAFARMNADSRVMKYFPGILSPSESDALMNRMEAHFERHGFGLFALVLRETNSLIGFTGLAVPSFNAPFTPCVETGWRIASDFQGRGLATEAARAALQFGFEELRLQEIVSFTTPGNLRSRRVMEKLGMKLDPAAEFDHPGIAQGHPLRRHVLYRISERRDARASLHP